MSEPIEMIEAACKISALEERTAECFNTIGELRPDLNGDFEDLRVAADELEDIIRSLWEETATILLVDCPACKGELWAKLGGSNPDECPHCDGAGVVRWDYVDSITSALGDPH